MNNRIIFFLVIFLIASCSQEYQVRIGIIGNSITQGSGLDNPETEAYPNQLQVLLNEVYGDTVVAKNFGLTTTTMLKKGNVPYWNTQQFIDYLAYAPDICFIMLGTNDTKPVNWHEHSNEFIDDYLAMIDTILSVNPKTKFMVAYPPPVYEDSWGIRESVIVNGIIPAVDSVLTLIDAELMDFYHPLLDSAHFFPDNIHPNAEGATAMAELLLNRIIETDIIH